MSLSRKILIKTTVRYHAPSTRTAITETQTMANAGKDTVKSEPYCKCWWENKMAHPLWKPIWQSFQKLSTEPFYDVAVVLPGVLQRCLHTKHVHNS